MRLPDTLPTTAIRHRFIAVKRTTGDGFVETQIQAHIGTQGLAYHLTLGCNGRWTVTHIASSHALCQEATEFKNERQCEAFIERIADLCDWTTEKPEPGEDTKVAIRRIAKDCQASYNYTPVF